MVGTLGTSRAFDIRAGVRQGCVLSPRLLSCVLQFAMRSWRHQMQTLGIDLRDSLPLLLDLRLADGILRFATSAGDVARILDALVTALSGVGLILNASKTVVLTTKAQATSELLTPGGIAVRVIDRTSSHK